MNVRADSSMVPELSLSQQLLAYSQRYVPWELSGRLAPSPLPQGGPTYHTSPMLSQVSSRSSASVFVISSCASREIWQYLAQPSSTNAGAVEQLNLAIPIVTAAYRAVDIPSSNEKLIDHLDSLENELLAKKYEGALTPLEDLQLHHVQAKKDKLLGLEKLEAPADADLLRLDALLEKTDELIGRVDRLLELEGKHETG